VSAALRRPPSLRRRLLVWLVLLHLLAIAATAWASYVIYDRVIEGLRDEQMRTLAESYAGHREAPPLPTLPPGALRQHGALAVQLWQADGRTLLAASAPVSVPLQGRAGFADASAGPGGAERWRVYTAPAGPAADSLRVQVLQSEAWRHHRSVQRALIEGLPIALLLPAALVLLWVIVWSASRALRAVAAEVATQDEDSVDGLPPERVPEEIAPLVGAFNSLLARLRDALATQRRLVQDPAHELRTPVTAIALQVENLRAHMPPGEAQERFALLEAGVARTRHLLEQLLRLSRQEAAGRGAAVDAQRVPLAALLGEAIAQFADRADLRRVDLGLVADPALADFALDGRPQDLRSLFDNLIDNALRHTAPGSTVDVRLHRVDGCVAVDVVDDGPGIDEAVIGRVFDRFFRAPGAAPGGSGLGLAIAQAAASRHGLRIELRNRGPQDGGRGLVARVRCRD
jgi:signal transduction histidine kinase